jgi:hypothetical protein
MVTVFLEIRYRKAKTYQQPKTAAVVAVKIPCLLHLYYLRPKGEPPPGAEQVPAPMRKHDQQVRGF